MPNRVNKQTAPARYAVKSHLPSCLKTLVSPFTYFPRGGGSFSCLFFNKNPSQNDRRNTKAGNAKNTQNQAINAINDPKMGDSTFPKPFEASTRPSTRLSSAPLKGLLSAPLRSALYRLPRALAVLSRTAPMGRHSQRSSMQTLQESPCPIKEQARNNHHFP